MNPLLQSAAERASRYLDTLDQRGVAPGLAALAKLERFDEPLPDQPTDPETVLAMLDEVGSPATVATAGNRFFGLVIGGSLPVTLASNWLASTWDQNAGFYAISPVAAMLEEISERWLIDVLRLPQGTGAAFLTGATMANFSALAAARNTLLQRAAWDVEADGLLGAPPITVIVGAEIHPSVIKSLGMLGLGRNRVVTVPVDSQGRMRADAFPKIRGPAIVCIQAGNVNSGALDPAPDIIAMAHNAGAWVHVDGAFGLWAAAAPKRASLMQGFSYADSWATEAHKWLNIPYDCGLAFVRNPEPLRAAMSVTAAYLPQGDRREPSQLTPELSRRARGIEVWAALRTLGRSGLADMIERSCRQATRFAEGLRAADFEILNEVVLNQVVVAFGDADATRRVIGAIQADGTLWAGETKWQNRIAMRISVSSWATTDEDVEKSLNAILRLAKS